MNYLTSPYKKNLLDLRRELYEYFSMKLGKDVDYPDDGTINYMEAYKRYTGPYSQIYGQILYNSWEGLKKNINLDLVIVSALYGLLRYDESIRNYDIIMKKPIEHQLLKRWWRNNDLCPILIDYINKNNIKEVHNLLSNDYNEALRGCFDDIGIEYSYHNFSKYKSGSNAYRGKWINEFLQNF